MSFLYIDIREENEILDYQIKPKNGESNVTVINIPTRNIFANVDYINQLSEKYDTVYIICRTGRRSQQVKDKYFHNNSKIFSYQGGWKWGPAYDYNPNIELVDNYSLFNMAPRQYMQSVIVLFLMLVMFLIYHDTDKMNILLIIGLMTCLILFQIVTKDCLIASMIKLST